MPSTGKPLWTPQGEHYASKDEVPINRMELITLSRLHEFAQQHGISLVCKRCDSAITGQNNDNRLDNPHPSVSCKCREFRYFGG